MTKGTMRRDVAEEVIEDALELCREALEFDPDEMAAKYDLTPEALGLLMEKCDEIIAAQRAIVDLFWATFDAREADDIIGKPRGSG